MPNIKIERERFYELMGQKYEFEWLDDLGFEFGIEIEEDEERDKDGKVVKEYFKFDCMNNRPDLLTEATLTRAFKIYLQQMKPPQVVLTPPTTSMTVDPSVPSYSSRFTKFVHSLPQPSSEMFLSMRRPTKPSLLPKKNFTIPFVELVSMPLLELTILIL